MAEADEEKGSGCVVRCWNCRGSGWILDTPCPRGIPGCDGPKPSAEPVTDLRTHYGSTSEGEALDERPAATEVYLKYPIVHLS